MRSSLEIIFFLIIREIKIRYAKAFFGIAWLFARPLFVSALHILWIAHGLSYSELPSKIPLIASLAIPTSMIVNALVDSSSSILRNGHLISRFPLNPLYFPIVSAAIVILESLLLSLIILLVGEIGGISGMWTTMCGVLILAPFALILSVVSSYSSLRYRDFMFLIPLLGQILTAFAPALLHITGTYAPLVQTLNPAVGVACVLSSSSDQGIGNAPLHTTYLVISFSITAMVALILDRTYRRKAAELL